MDASAALERLRDISSQVRAAVVFERGGKVVGSSIGDEERAQQVAREAGDLLADAERRRGGAGSEFAQLEVALQAGSVFVVRHGDLLIAATTPPEPTVGLVFYDLKSCLREIDEAASAKRAAPKTKAAPVTKATPTRRTTRAKKTDAQS
jgi:predicted regulator of Ras-like GTPase activity (Roadblock/LC7/MglB family)